MLGLLSNRQSDIRELLTDLRNTADPSRKEWLASHSGYSDDLVVDLVLVKLEMDKEPNRQVTANDLVWAGTVLDHLDTLGKMVVPKDDR